MFLCVEIANSFKYAQHTEPSPVFVNTLTGGVLGGLDAYVKHRQPKQDSKCTTKDGGKCFVAGTLVKTEDEDVPIEEIEAGDLVWAWDEATGDVALKKVVETYVNESRELVHLFVNGEEIIATANHPFYCPIQGWTAACKLRAGDILVTVNGEYVVVEKVQYEQLESPAKVYNFQVEKYHTYYVSSIAVLVHNTCGEHQFGERSPKKVSVPDGAYTQIDSSGEVYSYTLYNSKGQQVIRYDFKGKPHAGVLPHIHVYGYNSAGKQNFHKIYDFFGNLISK